MTSKSLKVVPLELRDANSFIEQEHRHHKKVQGHRFSIGVVDEAGKLRGCAVVGRPTSGLDPTKILEVTRMCSDGSPNVCSLLYSAVVRAAKALGYARVQTYIYKTENGASLKASGFLMERAAHPSGRHRTRTDGTTRDLTHVSIPKTLWVKDIAQAEKQFSHHRRKPTNQAFSEDTK
jgi:hypothetical protein